MTSIPYSLEDLLKKAIAAEKAMSHEEREEMYRKQREGWVKAEIEWAKDFREGKCRYD